MQKISLIKSKLFFLFFIFVFFSQQLFANENIIIDGNENISSKTIYSFAPRNIQSLDPKLLNDFQKKIYEVGLPSVCFVFAGGLDVCISSESGKSCANAAAQ